MVRYLGIHSDSSVPTVGVEVPSTYLDYNIIILCILIGSNYNNVNWQVKRKYPLILLSS